MPIKIKCQCGKALSIPDAMMGKAVKCPGCGKVLKVPATGQQAPAATRKAPAGPAPRAAAPATSSSGGLDDLFDEEGFSTTVAAVCPSCAAEMAANAVLCTKCGFHKEHGVKFESHKTAGVDIDRGTLALMKAETDMAQAAEMQAKLVKGAGMPWWALGLILFMIISGLTIGVLTVNAARREDQTVNFNPMGLFLTLAAVGFNLVSFGMMMIVLVHAFKQDLVRGLLCIFIPFYIFYHVFTNASATWKPFVISLVTSGIAGGLYVAAAGQ